MKHWMSLALALTVIPQFSAWADPKVENVYEETLYHNYQNVITGKDQFRLKSTQGFTAQEQTLFVDALWDLVEDGNPDAIDALDNINTFMMDITERLRVGILRIKYKRAQSLPESLVEELSNVLMAPEADTRLIYTLAAYETELLAAGHDSLITLAKTHNEYYDVAENEAIKRDITDDVIEDIFHQTPDVTTYMNGEYVKSVKIYMFCRENRLYPCLMVMRDIHGEVVRQKDGTIWAHPALASSARGLPSYTRNGNTPQGVLTIDSVMPTADQQLSFGKFRRLILNFVPKSKNEVLLSSLLPKSSHAQSWWKESVTARDAGRNLFRIHGSGKINKDPSTPYYPFMRTSGCIAQRENTYDGVTYKDQRELLDAVMVAMDMTPNYANEVKAKGILYLVEIDDKNAPVDTTDLALRGIE